MKRAKAYNATKSSIDWLVSQGWTVDKVEQRIPHTFITRDCFGFADLLACKPGEGVCLVQVTGGVGRGNANTRINKITNDEPAIAAKAWLDSGGLIVVHNWRKITGQKARTLEITQISLDHFKPTN